jgi:chemotaxis signal transduction protein
MPAGPLPRRSFDWDAAHARLERIRRAIESGAEPAAEDVERILRERARELARPAREEAPVELQELLVCRLGDERYAIDVAQVAAAFPLRGLIPVPGAPPPIAGVMHHRGAALSVVDLRPLIGLPAAPREDGSRVVAVEAGGKGFGILFDAVLAVERIPVPALQPPPARRDGSGSLVRALTPEGLSLLDVEALAADPRILVDQEIR